MIKTLPLALIFIGISLPSTAQQHTQIAAGYPIRLGDYPCTTVIASDNGELIKQAYGDSCSYKFVALDTGLTSIFIRGSKRSDTLKLHAFSPKVYVSISGRRSGEMSKPFFRVSRGIIARIDLDPAYQVKIKNYTITIVRNAEIEFSKTSQNVIFDEDPEITMAFDKLQKGDQVIFSKIKCELFNQKIVEAAELKLTII